MARETPKAKEKSLTLKQEKFAHHYALHQDATAAYRHSHPDTKAAPDSIYVSASRMLADAKVKLRIEALMQRKVEALEQRFDITVDRIAQELAAIAFANADDYYSWGTIDRICRDNEGEIERDADGKPYTEPRPFVNIKPSDELTRIQKKAIAGAEMSYAKDGSPMVAVKMSDKRAALKDLMAILKPEAGVNIGTINVTIANADDEAL